MKRIGDNGEPCGTPAVVGKDSLRGVVIEAELSVSVEEVVFSPGGQPVREPSPSSV